LFSRGIDTGLDFSNMNEIVKIVENASNIPVHPRHPYAGTLVFTAFSGSHQDAIRKGMEAKEKSADLFKQGWKIPYLHLDPADVGRNYERLIRINSQSGKGGVAYVLEHEFGIFAPKAMHPEIGQVIQHLADDKGNEIDSKELLKAFEKTFINVVGKYKLQKFARVYNDSDSEDSVTASLSIEVDGKPMVLQGSGNGPISAAVHALQKSNQIIDFILDDFSEKSLGHTADATAIAFVGIRRVSDDKLIYGVGEHSNIDQAAIQAIFAALNRATAK
jgi:2-isopropylmalate synthase